MSSSSIFHPRSIFLARALWLTCAIALGSSQVALAQKAAPPTAKDAPATDGPAGVWRGRIEVPGQPLDVVVTFKVDAKKLLGTITIPAQKAKDLELGVEQQGNELTFAIEGVPGEPTFVGKVANNELSGSFTQGGQEFDFALTRDDAKHALGDLAQAIEKARVALDVPGLAVAVIKNGEVLLSQGFGVRNIDSKEPVTPRSLFAIGSSTKAMTAFVLSTLLAESTGLAAFTWDSPVRDVVPGFRLADATASQLCTLRDLASHRSGLPRHDLVWYLAPQSRDELLRRLPHLPLSKSPRTQFQYCNHGYAVLGEATALLAGTTWEEVMQTRLFTPLGMRHTRTHAGAFVAGDETTAGHQERDDALRVVPRREIGGMGPAGSVESCVEDIARWLALQLGEGVVDGQKICDGALLLAQRTPLIPFAAPRTDRPEIVPAGYGLGWFVDAYRGHLHVHHGGGIDGFIAHIGFFPNDGLGIVALANRDGTSLPGLIDRMAADRLLGHEAKDWAGEAATARDKAKKAAADASASKDKASNTKLAIACAHPLADYAGHYTDAGYGDLTIAVQGEGLVVEQANVRLPLKHVRRETFALEAKDALAAIDDVQVLFVTGFDGQVEGLRVKLEPTVPAITFRKRGDPALEDVAVLARYVGKYRAKDDSVATVTRDGNVLRLTLLGQPVYELKPRQTHLFQIGDLDGYHARFEGDGEAACAVVFEQPNGTFRFERLGD